jgi:exonuclease VII large subunit
MPRTTRTGSASTPEATGGAPTPCGACSEALRDSQDQAVACDVCNRWYHLECTDLTQSDLKTVSKISIKWHCHTCNDVLGTFDTRLSSIEKLINKQLATQNSHYENLDKTWASVTFKLDLNRSFIKKQVQTLKTDLKTDLDKEKEKEFRAKNVVIFGIQENDKTTFDETLKQIQSVLDECSLPPINEPQLNIHRLGPRTAGKNRPIRIKLSSDTQKWEYLKRINQNRIKGVFARLDLDREEQEQDFRLRKELKEKRKEDPETHYKIAKGAIVKVRKP